jgi:hypothetical protein
MLICYAMLRCANVCYAMPCYSMLCYAMLCFAMLCYALLCYALLYYALLCYAVTSLEYCKIVRYEGTASYFNCILPTPFSIVHTRFLGLAHMGL